MKLIIYTLCFLFYTSITIQAADLQKIMGDTQRLSNEDSQMILVWWIPTAYWEESFRNEKTMTEAQKTGIIAALDEYTIFAVIKGKFGTLAELKSDSREKLLAETELKIAGKVIPPLSENELKPATKNLLSMMKPLIGNMLGTFGQGLEFIVYPNRKNSEALLDPKKEGSFDYKVDSHSYHWRLPLGSLLPSKVDAATGEEFPGSYLYNPYNGKKL